VHWHAPLAQVPGLPPAAVHCMELGALLAMHVLPMQTPTLHPWVMALQSAFVAHCTH
jgi:hypothetical protein